MGLAPAQAHPSVLRSCTEERPVGDNTMWWQPKPPQVVSVLLKMCPIPWESSGVPEAMLLTVLVLGQFC